MALLPYHSNVNAADVAAGLNRLIDDAAAGRQIFYDIYDQAAKAQDPSIANAGLFFIGDVRVRRSRSSRLAAVSLTWDPCTRGSPSRSHKPAGYNALP